MEGAEGRTIAEATGAEAHEPRFAAVAKAALTAGTKGRPTAPPTDTKTRRCAAFAETAATAGTKARPTKTAPATDANPRRWAEVAAAATR